MSLSKDVVIDFYKIDESHVVNLLKNKKSFIIENVPRLSMGEASSKIERLIDAQGMRSRVYAKGRSAAVAGLAIPTLPTIAAGATTAAFIAGHKAVTFNPDYEIGTNRATGTLTITYTKWESLAAATSSVGDTVGSVASKLKNKIFG